jgi:hypothetical protein
MTQEEYNQAQAQGQINFIQPNQTPAESEKIGDFGIKEYEGLLGGLRKPRIYLTAVPTFVPKTFADSIQYYDDGVDQRIYFYFNGVWHAISDIASINESQLSLSDVTTDDVSSSKHGFAPKSPADVQKFLNGASTPGYAQVKDSDLSVTDITTNNVTTSKHGFTPKAPNDTSKFLRGDGSWAAPTASIAFTTDVNSRSGDAVSGTQTIAHGLGKTPSFIRITAYKAINPGAGSTQQFMKSVGTYDGTHTASVRFAGWEYNAQIGAGSSQVNIIHIEDYSAFPPIKQVATITVDATNIYLEWTKTGSPTSDTIYLLWEAMG